MRAQTLSSSEQRTPQHIQLLEGLLPFLLGIDLLVWLILLPNALRGHSDFRQLYAAGYMARTGHAHQIYDNAAQFEFQQAVVGPAQIPLPFIRPAYCVLLFAPLSLLPYRAAYLVFLSLNAVLLAICCNLMTPLLKNLARLWSWLPVILFASFYPISAAFLQGQDSILLLTAMIACLCLMRNNSQLAAGLLLGFMLFKFQIVIPMALLLLAWKCYRFFTGFLISAGTAVAVSIAVVGWNESKHYVHLLLSTSDTSTLAANDRIPVLTGSMPNLHGLVFGLATGHLSQFWIKVISVLMSVAVLAIITALDKGLRNDTDQFVLATAAAVLASYYLFLHDVTVLLIPLTITLDRLSRCDFRPKAIDHWLAWTSTFMFLAPISDLFAGRYRFLLCLPILMFLGLLVSRYLRKSQPSLQSRIAIQKQPHAAVGAP